MPDLITTTLTAITVPGMSSGDASRSLVESINAELGTNYATNDLGKWKRADRPVPQPVQDWMLRASIGHAIAQCGGIAPFDDAGLDRLASMLCPPAR
jgi:hypothetical protein